MVERNNEIVLQYKKQSELGAVASMTLTPVIDNSPADGTTANQMLLQAFNHNNQPVANAAVNWSVSGNAQLLINSSVTNTNGRAYVNLTNKTAEQVEVTAQSNSVTITKPSSFAKSVAVLELSLLKDNSQANGVDANEALVTVRDALNNPMPDIVVSWSVDNGATIISSEDLSDPNGQAKLRFASRTQGALTLNVSAEGKTASQAPSFSQVTVNSIALMAKQSTAPADGTSANVVEILVSDEYGAPIANTTVNWSVTGSATLSNSTPTARMAMRTLSSGPQTLATQTNANGIAQVQVRDAVSETVTLTGSAGVQSSNTALTFSPLSVGQISVSTSADNAASDGISNNAVQAIVTDTAGNPKAGVSINWAVTGNARLASVTSTTDASGIASVNLTNISPESVTVTASAEGISGTSNTRFTAAPVNSVGLSIIQNNALADGSAANSAQALVRDAGGNPLAGVDVSWTVTGNATLQSTTTQTDASGIAQISLTDTTAETVTITASAGAKSDSVNVLFTQVPVDSIAISITQNNALADGLATNSAQALVRDANGNPLSGVPVTWTVNGNAILQSTTTQTDASGIATVQLTNTEAQSVKVTATATAGGNTVSATDTAIFSPIPVDKVELSITRNNAIADGITTNQVQVLVTSAGGVPMANSSVTWSLSSNTAIATTSLTGTTDGAGIATLEFTDTVVEPVTVTAVAWLKTDSGVARFITLPVDSILVSISQNNSPADGTAANIVQAIVLDASNNPLIGVDVNWAVTGSAALQGTTTQTNASGIATVSLTNTVGESVTVTGSAGTKSDSATATFTALPVHNIVVSMVNDGAPADGLAPNTAQALVTNRLNAPMEGVTISWSVDGAANLVSGTSITDTNGIATIDLTNTYYEDVTVTASADNKNGSTTAHFVKAPANSIVVSISQTNSPADGNTANIAEALVRDSDNNPLAGVDVNWAVSGSAALESTTTRTNASGIATVRFTDTVSENVLVTGSTEGESDSATATFISNVGTVALNITKNNSPADGITQNIAQAEVRNRTGALMRGVQVIWNLPGHARLSSSTSITDSNGIATVEMTNLVAESTDLSATAGGESSAAMIVSFVAPPAAAIEVTTDQNSSPADGSSHSVRARVINTLGNSKSGVNITWSVTGSAQLGATNSTTDSNGEALVTLTNRVAETVSVKASAGTLSSQTEVIFVSP